MIGIMEAGWQAFALVVATGYFEGSATAKAVTAIAFTIGPLLNPVTTHYAGKRKLRPSSLGTAIFLSAPSLCSELGSLTR